MSLTNNNDMVMPVAPMYGNGNGFGFGNDGGAFWLLVLFLFAFNGGWGNGFGGGNGGAMPYVINNDVQRGFDQSAIMGSLNGITSAISSGFANAEVSRANANTNLLQSMWNMQMSQQQCCCDTRSAIADVKYSIATENCADRQALNEGVRDIIASNTASTQRILDQLCQDKIDAKNDEIAQLRQEVLYARGQASQVAQNSSIINGIYDRLSQCPVGTVPVYGEQPIFTCGNNLGCGCGVGIA